MIGGKGGGPMMGGPPMGGKGPPRGPLDMGGGAAGEGGGSWLGGLGAGLVFRVTGPGEGYPWTLCPEARCRPSARLPTLLRMAPLLPYMSPSRIFPRGPLGPMMPPMGAPFPPPGKGFPMMGGKGVPPMAGKGMPPYPGSGPRRTPPW